MLMLLSIYDESVEAAKAMRKQIVQYKHTEK